MIGTSTVPSINNIAQPIQQKIFQNKPILGIFIDDCIISRITTAVEQVAMRDILTDIQDAPFPEEEIELMKGLRLKDIVYEDINHKSFFEIT